MIAHLVRAPGLVGAFGSSGLIEGALVKTIDMLKKVKNAGAADIYQPQPHQVTRYTKNERYQTFSFATLAYSYIGYNLRRAPFNDQRWLGSFGGSLTMTLFPPLVVRTDFARVHDFESLTSWRFDFSLSYLY